MCPPLRFVVALSVSKPDSDAEQHGVEPCAHVLKADAEISARFAVFAAEVDTWTDRGIETCFSILQDTPYSECSAEIEAHINGKFVGYMSVTFGIYKRGKNTAQYIGFADNVMDLGIEVIESNADTHKDIAIDANPMSGF